MNEKKQKEEETIFEKVIGDSWKERVKNVVGDLKLPKEALTYILSQVDETKHAAVGIISKEVKKYLENTDISKEMLKVLSNLSLEITTNIKFVHNENDSKKLKLKITNVTEAEKDTASKENS
ncbi:MAG: hypothetical protein JXR91_02455 [Deltaproteobacteria bacterium]|nr:hypothetical protein [Deltaproteobacteria bacterium]